MRFILFTLLLTGAGASAARPDAPATVVLVGTWVDRMAADPARTGREIADYFVRLDPAEWRPAFAIELRLFELLAALERLDRGAPQPADAVAVRAVGLDPFADPLENAHVLARSFLTSVARARPTAFAPLLRHLLERGGGFWADRIIEDLIERTPPAVALLRTVVRHLPASAFPRAARAIAAARYDARDAGRLMNDLVLVQALRGTPLTLRPTGDARADRDCARLLAASIALLDAPAGF